MTFLQLCQRWRLECSINGTGPTTVLGAQTTEIQRGINWIADAWRELQGTDSWSWQWESPTLTIPAGAHTPVVANTIAPVRWDKAAAFLGTMQMDYFPWDEFRLRYPVSQISTGTPIAWSIRPDLAFVVNTNPTVSTAIVVERYANPTELVDDTDEPGLPADLHMYLVWAAVAKYAARDEAGSLYQTANKYAADIKASIVERCLPEFRLGGALC